MEYIWRSFGEPRSIKLLATIKHCKQSLISSVLVIFLDILLSMVLLLRLSTVHTHISAENPPEAGDLVITHGETPWMKIEPDAMLCVPFKYRNRIIKLCCLLMGMDLKIPRSQYYAGNRPILDFQRAQQVHIDTIFLNFRSNKNSWEILW